MIWLHGVSVGESLANVTLVKALAKKYPNQKFLLTSTTKTSATLLKKHVNDHVSYETYPLDFPWKVNAFLNKHNPSFVIFGESELWPFMLSALRKRNIPAVLINARLSEKSYNRWCLLPFLIKPMLATFSCILAQSKNEATRYTSLGGGNVFNSGNLKFASEPLTYDKSELNKLKQATKGRRLLLFASTHAPEEEISAQIHNTLKTEFSDLLSIIIPRHPERGSTIKETISNTNNIAQRSMNEPITTTTDIYLADTLGELGLFYTLCPIAFLGNSLTTQPGGGHNPIEPAHLDCSILYGPHMFNFDVIDQEIRNAKAVIKCDSVEDLRKQLSTCLKDQQKIKTLTQNAKLYAQSKRHVLDEILEKLCPLIDTSLKG